MNLHEERIKILKKYENDLKRNLYPFYVGKDIPSLLLINAIKKYAKTVKLDEVIGLCDGSINHNGKSGFIFTDYDFYFTEVLGKPQCVKYSDIEHCSVIESNDIFISFKNGKSIRTYNSALNHNVLKKFLEEIKQFNENAENGNITTVEDKDYDKKDVSQKNFTNYTMNNYLDEEQKQTADEYLLALKIITLSKGETINNYSLQDICNNALEEIENITDDIPMQKYLMNKINCLFDNFSLSFKDLEEELNKYTTEAVIDLFSEISSAAEENSEDIDSKLLENYRVYIRRREAEDEYNSCLEDMDKQDVENQVVSNSYADKISVPSEMQNQEIRNQTPKPKKEHPILKKIGKFAKNATIEIVGDKMGLTNSQIEKIKGMDNTMEAITNMYDTALDNASKLPKSTNHTSSESLMEKAWRKRGIDYKKLQSLSDEQKGNYLRSVGINSRDESRSIYNDVMREVANELKSRRQN